MVTSGCTRTIRAWARNDRRTTTFDSGELLRDRGLVEHYGELVVLPVPPDLPDELVDEGLLDLWNQHLPKRREPREYELRRGREVARRLSEPREDARLNDIGGDLRAAADARSAASVVARRQCGLPPLWLGRRLGQGATRRGRHEPVAARAPEKLAQQDRVTRILGPPAGRASSPLAVLVTLVHDRTSSRFVSLRCNKDSARDGLPDTSTIHFDNYGRPIDSDRECRDTNAGTYHVLLANYLGIRKKSFVEDRTNSSEVWNQPLRGYRFTQRAEVTATEANRLLGATSSGGTTVNRTVTVAKDAWSHQGSFPVTAGQSFVVRMTGTADADLYVNFGSQPTDSTYACRRRGSDSNETCELTVPTGATQAFVSVKGYAATSNVQLAITSGGSAPSAYVFNANAAKFYHVKAEVDYIGESSSNTDGNLSSRIDQYTHTDRYEYILEVDANGHVVGGEWVGASKTSHPDFLWLPTGVNGASVAGGKITYAQVKGLLDESVGPVTPPPPSGNERTVNESATIAKGAWMQYGPYNLAAGATLTATLSGSGDADLYVRRGAAPTATSYDCRPYASGSAETCSVVGPAQVYVGVNGYATSSAVQLRAVYTEGGAVTPPPPPTTFTHLSTSGTVAQGEMKIFQLAVPAGRQIAVRTTASVDIDLYTRLNQAPTTSSYLGRGYTDSGNETVTYTAATDGTLYIGVHGYEVGSFTLVTSDN